MLQTGHKIFLPVFIFLCFFQQLKVFNWLNEKRKRLTILGTARLILRPEDQH